MTIKILACECPRNPCWEIVAPPNGYRVLLMGWRMPELSGDSGVDTAVADVLARALTAMGRVIFSVERDALSGIAGLCDEVSDLTRSGLFGRLSAALRGEPRSWALVGASQPAAVVHAFSDTMFSWELSAQRLLLVTHGSSGLPPRETWLAFMYDDLVAIDELVMRQGALGFMLPGVDGDVAAFYAPQETTQSALINALTSAANDAGASFDLLSEDAFASALADARHVAG